jgi:hypothetical protein
MKQPPAETLKAYTGLLEPAILVLRMRIRYSDAITNDELHDWLDALNNVPTMLLNYGGWHVEENIDADLARYDKRWLAKSDSTMRQSLVGTLRRCREGEFDHLWNF